MKNVDCARHGKFGALKGNFLIASSNLNFGYPFKAMVLVDCLVPQATRKIIANLLWRQIFCRRVFFAPLDIYVEFTLYKVNESFASMETYCTYRERIRCTS